MFQRKPAGQAVLQDGSNQVETGRFGLIRIAESWACLAPARHFWQHPPSLGRPVVKSAVVEVGLVGAQGRIDPRVETCVKS